MQGIAVSMLLCFCNNDVLKQIKKYFLKKRLILLKQRDEVDEVGIFDISLIINQINLIL